MNDATNSLGFKTGLSEHHHLESFWCDRCNYHTRDSFTVEAINDLTGCCPSCSKQAADFMFGGRSCNEKCSR